MHITGPLNQNLAFDFSFQLNETLSLSWSYNIPVFLAPFQEPPEQCWAHAQLEPFLEFVNEAIRSGRLKPDPLVPVQIEPSARVAELARQRALLEG